MPDVAPRVYGYTAYPYASVRSAYVLTEEPGAERAFEESQPAREFAGQVAFDTGYLYGVAHAYLHARIMTPSPFELALHARSLYEPSVDHAALFGGGDLAYRVVQLPRMLIRLGFGLRGFSDAERTFWGAGVGMGLEVFVLKPLVLSFSALVGKVGEALAVEARAQFGVMVARTELYVGFERFTIGLTELDRPLIGVRVWL